MQWWDCYHIVMNNYLMSKRHELLLLLCMWDYIQTLRKTSAEFLPQTGTKTICYANYSMLCCTVYIVTQAFQSSRSSLINDLKSISVSSQIVVEWIDRFNDQNQHQHVWIFLRIFASLRAFVRNRSARSTAIFVFSFFFSIIDVHNKSRRTRDEKNR